MKEYNIWYSLTITVSISSCDCLEYLTNVDQWKIISIRLHFEILTYQK